MSQEECRGVIDYMIAVYSLYRHGIFSRHFASKKIDEAWPHYAPDFYKEIKENE